MKIMRMKFLVTIFLISAMAVFAQDASDRFSQGSIPGELLRPRHGEPLRFPIDTVIGGLGQGRASAEAYAFAVSLAAGFASGDAGHIGLATVSVALRENYLSVLRIIEPTSYRLGSGREEPDGSISFLIRFLGREQSITGELFVRYVTRRIEETVNDEVTVRTVGSWTFEDLILEGARTREQDLRENMQRFDFSPYERFF